MEDKEQLKNQWYSKRKVNTILGTAQVCVYYFEYSAISVSALYYYNDVIKAKNPNLFIGLVMAAIYVSGTISSYICGRFMDETRNSRKIGLFVFFFSVIGNLVYSMPFSPWLPVIGRLMCGFNAALGTSVAAEFSRVYNPKDLIKVLSWYNLLPAVFMTIAPCSPLLFKGVDFYIGNSWHINEYNCIGLLLAAISLVLLIAFYFGATNLTLDPAYPLVRDEILVDSDKACIDIKSKNFTLLTTKDFFTNFDRALILITQAVISFQFYQLELLINMTALYKFHWTLTRLALVTALCVAATSAFLIFLQAKGTDTAINVFFFYVVLFVLMVLLQTLLNLAVKLDVRNDTIQIVIITLVLFMNTIPGCTQTLYGRIMMFSLTPAHSASIAESHINLFGKTSACVGYFTAALAFKYMFPCLVSYNVFCYTMIILLLLRKSSILANNKYEY